MKPCSRNRKLLAWLALGELDARRAGALRAHMQTCEGCRRYWKEMSAVTERLAAAEAKPEVQASESFHRRMVSRLRAEQSGSLWQALVASLAAARLNWRVAVPVAGAVALVVAMLAVPVRHPAVTPPAPIGAQAVSPAAPKGELPPTIANYQRAANNSLDELDELLTRQANRKPSPAPIYTASIFALPSTSN